MLKKVSTFLNPKSSNLYPKRGFTLLELLVSVAIISILSAVGMVTYSEAQKFARDAKRKEDLKAIGVALELFYHTNKKYPNGVRAGCTFAGDWCISGNGRDPWIPELSTSYINTLPKDPSTNTNNPHWIPGGGYAYVGCGNQGFVLLTVLENANDPDVTSKRHYKWCDGVTDFSGWWHPNVFAVVGY
jgi:prepilin-type N-terminal cleavage/methylation domain-containing protein